MTYRHKAFILTTVLILYSIAAGAQNVYSLKGKIKEQKTNDIIPYINIYDSIYNIHTTTDSNGNFELTLKGGTYNFEISGIGYQTITKKIELDKHTTIELMLQQLIQLEEVTVAAEKISKTAEMNTSGMTTLSSAGVERLPAFLGEKDIMKAILLTPGIQGGQEGARGIFVRGGSPDQNLILFHNATVFNPSHIFGFLSVFTTESLKKMDIHKSYIPVQYGGRLSSVLNIEPNFGNTQQWKGSYSISFITSKFNIEGPIKKDKTTFNFSIRDCHAGLFTKPLSNRQYRKEGEEGELNYFFYDINAALQHKVNDKNTLSWSFYTGSDLFSFGESNTFPKTTDYYKERISRKLVWMNAATTIEWKTQLKKIKMLNTYSYSHYRLSGKQGLETVFREYNENINEIYKSNYNSLSKINEHKWQTVLEHSVKKMHFFNYGIQLNGRVFSINKVDAITKDSSGNTLQEDKLENPNVQTLDFYTFADYRFKWKDKLEINAGLQLFLYFVNRNTFFYPQPRAEIIYHPIEGISIRSSIIRTAQPMHLLTNNTGDILNDVWVPATAKVEPETAWQYSGGIQYDHPKGYTASIDAYYKSMHHLSEYKYGNTFILNNIPWDDQLLNTGTGKAYGLEFFFAKTKGQFTAWFKYNLGWSTRNFPEINEGKTFFYKYDRRHDLSIVLQYKLKKHFDFTVAWTYGTGWRMTTPNAAFASDATLFNYDIKNNSLVGTQNFMTFWNDRNNYVLPAFHHLDIGMNYTRQAKRVQHILNVSIYNVYNRLNIFTVYRVTKEDESGIKKRTYKQLSMFPIIPSVGYTLNFEIKKR